MSGYFFTPKPNPKAKKRLFCFPYAGGQAAIYFDWHSYVSDDIEVVTVQLPGRGARFLEPLMSDIPAAVNDICTEFSHYFDKPFAVFGHSNGALFAYEMIKQLSSSVHINNCQHLFLSAKSAPKMCYQREPLHKKNDSDFKQDLIGLGGTPEEILANDEVFDLLLPMIKADFKIGYEYVQSISTNRKINIKTTLFGGEDDTDISKQSMIEWREFLTGDVDYINIAGGHFFVHEQKEVLISHIKTKLSSRG
jgi:surfactin synthase thioesterase subunit